MTSLRRRTTTPRLRSHRMPRSPKRKTMQSLLKVTTVRREHASKRKQSGLATIAHQQRQEKAVLLTVSMKAISWSWMKRTTPLGTVLTCPPTLATKSRNPPFTISRCSRTSTATGPQPVPTPRSHRPSTSTCATSLTPAAVAMPKTMPSLTVPTSLATVRCSPPSPPRLKSLRELLGTTRLMDPSSAVSAFYVVAVTNVPLTALASLNLPLMCGAMRTKPETLPRSSPPWISPMKNKILALSMSRLSTLPAAR